MSYDAGLFAIVQDVMNNNGTKCVCVDMGGSILYWFVPKHPDIERESEWGLQAVIIELVQRETEITHKTIMDEVERNCEFEAGDHEHDWEVIDDSFSHEYGTEVCIYECCSICGESRDYHPDDDTSQPDSYDPNLGGMV